MSVDNADEKTELNIEIATSVKRELKTDAASLDIPMKLLAGCIIVDFLKLDKSKKVARLAQWKSTTLTREGSNFLGDVYCSPHFS